MVHYRVSKLPPVRSSTTTTTRNSNHAQIPLLPLAVQHAAGGQDSAALAQDPITSRSVVTAGDTARLQQALAKGRRGEPVTVAVIGGSITAGAGASSREKNYGSLMAQWWREAFPQAKIELVNAGIGATGSNYGALRAQRDLLDRRPDFVVVEYGVNDPNSRESAETLEGLIRQILKQPQQPAVVLLFMMHRNGTNAQEWHGKVGRHYGLPMFSLRDALWPEIEAGRLKWEDVEADTVHPERPRPRLRRPVHHRTTGRDPSGIAARRSPPADSGAAAATARRSLRARGPLGS